MRLLTLLFSIATASLAGCGGTSRYGYPYIPDPIDPATVPEAWATAPLPGSARGVLKPIGVRLLEPDLLIVDTLWIDRRWNTDRSQSRVARYRYNGEMWGAVEGKGLRLQLCRSGDVELLPIDISAPSKYSRNNFEFKTLEVPASDRVYAIFPLVYRTATPLEVGQCVTITPRRVSEYTVEPDTDPVTFTIAPYQGSWGRLK